jgi:predicted ATP-grasp superfamily ATP-dependent carboligase
VSEGDIPAGRKAISLDSRGLRGWPFFLNNDPDDVMLKERLTIIRLDMTRVIC